MAEINLSLSKKNFKLLVKHVFIGNWILTSTKIESDKEIDELYNTILSIAKNNSIMGGIQYDDSTDTYDFNQEKEQEMMKVIEEYEEECFWDDLVEKLAFRDAVQKNGEDKISQMDSMEMMRAIWAEEEKYYREFDENGIKRLKIVK